MRLAALGLLGAVIGFSVPARESRATTTGSESGLGPVTVTREAPLDAFYMGPGVSDSAPRATQVSSVGYPPPSFQQNEDGTTLVTIRWDFNNGETTERRSVQLILTSLPVPEPTLGFLGACAGSVVLLHRRRAKPSKHRPARVNLSRRSARRAIRQTPKASVRAARAPRERREQRRCQPASREGSLARLFPGPARLSSP